MTWLSVAEASELLHAREISPVELAEVCLACIAAHDARLRAFRSTGSAFVYDRGSAGWWQGSGYDLTKVGDRFVAGDFNEDAKADVATFYDYRSGAARIHVWLSSGGIFNYDPPTNPQLGWWKTASGYNLSYVAGRFVAGDFNGQ